MEKETIERAKFRAQYLEQDVYAHPNFAEPIPNDGLDIYSPSGYLLLRSISQLTDEEVVTLAKLMGIFDEAYGIGYYRREIAAYIAGDLRYIGYYGTALAITDYLRSIGILIPYMGHSVDDILQKGWAKIKEDMKLKVGDKVKIVSVPVVHGNEYGQLIINNTLNKEGVVIKIYANGLRNIYVRYLNYSHNYYSQSNLELITPNPLTA